MSVLQGMPWMPFLIIVAVFAGMTALLIFVALRARNRAGLIASTPTSNVAFAAEGYVELEGVAQPVNGLTLKAPLTGAPCLWYRVKLERWQRKSTSHGADHDWTEVDSAESYEPFLLVDSSGPCIVFPTSAEVTFTDRSVWYGATPIPSDTNPKRTRPTDPPESSGVVFGMTSSEYRYTEARIYPGDSLYALGQFHSVPWDTDDTADDDEPDEPADPAPPPAPGAHVPWDTLDRYDEIAPQAMKLTSRWIGKAKDKPFLLSTTPQAKLLELNNKGWKVSLGVALVPAAIVAFLLWARFS